MIDLARWLPLTWLGLALGCNDPGTVSVTGGGSGDGTGLGEPSELCASALDPSLYTTPAWSPSPITATPECPVVSAPFVVELSTVTVTGVVRMEGVPSPASYVGLVGRDGEGQVGISVADDGTFTQRILPGRYDVYVGNAPGALIDEKRLAIEDVELTTPTELALDIPPLVTMTGSMTLDGEPAPDPIGHIFIKQIDEGRISASELVSRMDRGTYSIVLAPGAYELRYSACKPDWESMIHVGDNPCYDPEIGELSPPFESPEQEGIPIATTVVVDQDVTLDLDVQTVRLSGSVAVDGLPADGVLAGITHERGGGGYLLPADDFDERVVVGTYSLWVDHAPPVFDALVLDEDTDVDVSLETFTMTLSLDDQRPAIDVPYFAGPRAIVSSRDGTAYWDVDLPLQEPLRVFADRYRISHLTKYCWPDYPDDGMHTWTRIHDALPVDGSLDVELTTPELARIELEYSDLARPAYPSITFQPADELEPLVSELSFHPGEPSFVAHGIIPAGTYRIRGEPVELVDGTRIRVIEQSQWIELQLEVDGVPFDPGHRLRLDEEIVDEGGEHFRPGRYDIRFSGGLDEGLPKNTGAIVGCITIEG